VDSSSKVVTRRTEEKVEEIDAQSFNKDALHLAGVLNVFDGIVATPGRV
jgi:hypothetical protein